MKSWNFGSTLFVRAMDQLNPIETAAWDKFHASNAALGQAFLSRTYVGHVASVNPQVRIVIGYESGSPAFFLPLQPKRGIPSRLGIFEPAGGVMSDYFGAIAAPGVQIEAGQLLAATRGRVNAVLFTHLDQSQALFGLRGEERRVGLRTHLGVPADGYWARLRTGDKKLVADTERREKKLGREVGSISFEWCSSRPTEGLEWLIDAKKRQYSRTGKVRAALFDDANVALLKGLAKTSERDCRGVLSILRCADTIVAAHFGLQCRQVLHVWFPVYDPGFSNYSPGRILLKYMFEAAAREGVEVFDRGEGDSQAKRDFANEEHFYSNGLWLAVGMRGAIARLALSVAWRIGRA
jgi:CelD/BcsL family acetyltransferase involved in cellulose biosynthesis